MEISAGKVEYLRKQFPGNIAMITNGSMISEANIKTMIECIDHISISLDGCDEELSTKIRRRNVFPMVKEVVDLLKKNDFKNISVSAILPNSYDVENKFIALCENWGVNPEIRSFSMTGRGNRNYKEIKDIFEGYIRKNKYETYNPVKTECLGGFHVCGAGKWNITIDSNGDVYPCNLLQEKRLIFGNVVDDINILDQYKQSTVYNFLENARYLRNTPCQSCEVRNVCWFCMSEMFVLSNDEEAFAERCKIKKDRIYKQLEEIF